MKDKLLLACALTGCFSVNTASAIELTDSWLNFREAYFTGSEQFQSKFEYGAKFDNGLYFAIQNTSGHGKRLDKFKSRYNEAETNYRIPLSSRVFFWPGAVYNWSASGSAFDPYVKLGVKATDSVMLAGGYRYNRNNYKSLTINGDRDNDYNHEINFWADWTVNEKIWTGYNFTYHKRSADFRYGNGTTENYEHSLAVSYNVDKNFTPYTDVTWLDKAGNGNNETRFRVGLFYHFR